MGRPEKVLDALWAHTHTQILIAALELDVFSFLSQGIRNLEELASAVGADRRGLEILLNALTGLGFLQKHNSSYHLTPDSEAYLVRGSPRYLGKMAEIMATQMERWKDLANVVRRGKPFEAVDVEEKGREFFPHLVEALFPNNYPVARELGQRWRVGTQMKDLRILDVAAGSGAWSIPFAQADPGTHVTALDFPEVLEITRTFVQRHKVEAQYAFVAGNLREVDFGEGAYDLVVLGHICHSEGVARTQDLLSKSYRALKKDGRVVIAEILPNDRRDGPPFPLIFAANMLIHTTEGNTFTAAEFRRWLQASGFSQVETLQLSAPSPLILAMK